jgi:hypothetical protein
MKFASFPRQRSTRSSSRQVQVILFNMETDPYIRAMFGEHAIHTPMNFVVQAIEPDSFVAMAQCRVSRALFKRLVFNSKKPHQLIMSDIILRPHLVMETEHLCGIGMAGIFTSSSGYDVNEWVQHGNKLFSKDY